MTRCIHWLRIALLVALLATLPLAAIAQEDSPYVENEWSYVDGSMDVSQGIPADAEGVLGRIRERGQLRVATEPYFPPQEFIDPGLSGQGKYLGSDMALARTIARRMGVELVIVPLSFPDVLTAVSDGDCDLAISALAFTPARAEMVEMSKGYYFDEPNTGSGLMIRSADAEAITGIEDLAGRDIAAQSASLQEALLAEHVTHYHEFRRLATMSDVYGALAAGEVDAAMVDVKSAQTYIDNNPDCGLMLVPDVRFVQEAQYDGDRVAGRKGELQLMYFVNGVIDEVLETGQYRVWYDRYAARAAQLGM